MGQYSTLVMIALMVVAFYFLILRPQKKRQQAMQQTLSALAPGSRVLLGSGLFGTIVSLGDRQAVLEISPGVELTVLKQAIVRQVTDADEDTEVYEDDELDETDLALDEPVQTAPEVDAPAAHPNTTPSAGADTNRLR